MDSNLIQNNLKFPIGKFTKPEIVTPVEVNKWIKTIATFPINLKIETEHLNEAQLDTPYREGGWTIRQVVHHCADSHINSFCRFKLALTEDLPVIRPYFEDRWAALTDSKAMPVDASLQIIEGLHQRWVVLLNSLSGNEFKRKYFHPEHNREIDLHESLAMYAWHCLHHLAHIKVLKSRMGWK